MFKDKDDKWTRERTFWEVNGGDLAMAMTAFFFLLLTLGGIAFLVIEPRINGLHQIFSDPPPPPPADQKLHLAPGETEMKLYPVTPAKPPEKKK